jgi:Tfp pilus assembly protein PilF
MADDPTAQADQYHERGYALHRQGELQDAAAHYREAIRLRPAFPIAWNNLALTHFSQGEVGEAERCVREALRLDPDLADAHNNLGMIHYQLARLAEAGNCFRGCLRLIPRHPHALVNLAIAEHALGRPDAAELGYLEALAAGAEPTAVHSNLSVLLREMGRTAEAETQALAALDTNPAHPGARINLALARLAQGRWAEAWPDYEARWAVGDLAQERRGFTQPQWTGAEPVAERVVLLHAEQGLGDTLQFCRYAPLVAERGAAVVLEVQPGLERLLAGLPGVRQVIARGDRLPDFDLHCPLMSLPMAFGTTPETVPGSDPYLAADPDLAADWAQRLSHLPGLRVGLVWAGSARAHQPHATAVDRRRSMRLAEMAPLGGIQGVSFVSLQLGPPAAQLREPPPGLVLHDIAETLHDFADTAAVVANLDLVISVDTAVVHLAGALGRPVWLLNRTDSCWRWLQDRQDSPWYPGLRQFRQARGEAWMSVMGRVRTALDAFLDLSATSTPAD